MQRARPGASLDAGIALIEEIQPLHIGTFRINEGRVFSRLSLKMCAARKSRKRVEIAQSTLFQWQKAKDIGLGAIVLSRL